MDNDLAKQDKKNLPMTPAQMKTQIQTIQAVLKDDSIMKKDVHFGKGSTK